MKKSRDCQRDPLPPGSCTAPGSQCPSRSPAQSDSYSPRTSFFLDFLCTLLRGISLIIRYRHLMPHLSAIIMRFYVLKLNTFHSVSPENVHSTIVHPKRSMGSSLKPNHPSEQQGER